MEISAFRALLKSSNIKDDQTYILNEIGAYKRVYARLNKSNNKNKHQKISQYKNGRK